MGGGSYAYTCLYRSGLTGPASFLRPGCPSSRGETVEEACMVHGIDVDKLLALVNEEANKAQ